MKIRDLVILAYGAFGGTIEGKTMLQKRIYFLGVGLGKESEFGYRAHSSSFAMVAESAGWETATRAAPLVKLPVSTTATNCLSWYSL